MELDQRNLEEEYSKLLACRSEAKRLVENMNALLPESDRFSADRREEPLGDLVKDARSQLPPVRNQGHVPGGIWETD